jgi:hypothetical protein
VGNSVKSMYYKGTPEKLKQLAEEYRMSEYDCEIVNGELRVHYGKRPRKQKKRADANVKTEKWKKREREFGYTRE